MNKAPYKELNLLVIKTKSKVFISDNVDSKGYFSTSIPSYIFDGERAINTYHKEWFQLSKIPELVQKSKSGEQTNIRYELRDTHLNTGLPKVLQSKDFNEDGEYEAVYGLYDRKYDMTESTLESIEFKLHVIEELDEFEIVKSEFNPQYPLLDRIQMHSILLPTRPCKLSREESYAIVRQYIKANIDLRYATVTSDYDFCLSVSKKIEHEPEAYRVDVGKRKPKYETRYRRSRTVEIYRTSPKGYEKYPMIEAFEGKSLEDLKNNVQVFLDELMKKINEPLKECQHCKGYGAILDEI